MSKELRYWDSELFVASSPRYWLVVALVGLVRGRSDLKEAILGDEVAALLF